MGSSVSFQPWEQAFNPVFKFAYQAFQQSKTVFALNHKTMSSRLTNFMVPQREENIQSLPPEVINKMRQRLDQLLEIDWQEAEQGIYPKSVLFDNAWNDFFQYYPMVWMDLIPTVERIQKKRYQEFSADIDTEGYPSYYLQNFHHQTDGYLSDLSANLYDLQVELLFNGAADAMRRRILAPLKTGLSDITSLESRNTKILDVACGTGRTLRFLRGMLSKVSLYGVDLSPAYLRKANQLLSEIPGELPQLIQGNAESLPFVDDYFHGLSCVFTFHELPATARQNVINEMFRVLKPEGVLVICDSIQAVDSPELKPMMENFPAMFHEPYYKHYIYDDFEKRLTDAGFQITSISNHFASKYWVAHKPSSTR
ncbi:class I SAM-dependent methyltransferase [Euhalothece natronophila Z-M001]|uniref:Class I SAM-dependent methyltransferase n=1 Tax=Euhalothece natronophila Z-M001 TaxID=522448 RepID=A0A5B8NJ59_9CHRO|nr:class I SAM-dependent methyltransferase [Euhalothece natronophila]QDZ38977.1 class I SAM-dependent methyltransferase [Euhalothece natronophila Z-M001]